MCVCVQMEEQKFDMDKLRRELEEKNSEIYRVKASLQSTEKVRHIFQVQPVQTSVILLVNKDALFWSKYVIVLSSFRPERG